MKYVLIWFECITFLSMFNYISKSYQCHRTLWCMFLFLQKGSHKLWTAVFCGEIMDTSQCATYRYISAIWLYTWIKYRVSGMDRQLQSKHTRWSLQRDITDMYHGYPILAAFYCQFTNKPLSFYMFLFSTHNCNVQWYLLFVIYWICHVWRQLHSNVNDHFSTTDFNILFAPLLFVLSQQIHIIKNVFLD